MGTENGDEWNPQPSGFYLRSAVFYPVAAPSRSL